MALSLYTSRFIGMMVGMFVFLTMASLAFVIFNDSRQPFEFQSVQVITPKIKNGDPLRVVYTFTRNRNCTTTIAQFWIDRTTGEALDRDVVPGGYSSLGPRITPVTLRPPIKFNPGLYTYRSVMNSDCGVQSFTTPVPDVDFEVVE